MNANVLREYLIALGFSVDQSELEKFRNILTDVGREIEGRSSGMFKAIAEVGVAIVGVYSAVAAGAVGLADHVADADLKQQLFAMRMYMSVDAAKRLQIAQEALGHSLEEIVWNPELHRRFDRLNEDQKTLQKQLGPDFERNMVMIRDIRFEFTRLRVEGQYLAMEVVSNLLRSFGSSPEQLLEKLRDLNRWAINDLPKVASGIIEVLKPALGDAGTAAKDLWYHLDKVLSVLLKIVGALSGDSGLSKGEVTFKNMAHALSEMSMWAAQFMNRLTEIVDSVSFVAKLIYHASNMDTEGIRADFKQATLDAAEHTRNSRAITARHLTSLEDELAMPEAQGSPVRGSMKPMSMHSHATSLADQARELAKQVSAKTGVPAELIFGQWAHETGGFTNRGATGLNNLAGIKSGDGYRSFGSLSDFASFYQQLILSPRYTSQGVLQSQTAEDFASALKSGGYYEDSYANYSRGIKRWERDYSGGGGGGTTIGKVEVNINHPNATPPEISQAVVTAIQREKSTATQRTTVQLANAY